MWRGAKACIGRIHAIRTAEAHELPIQEQPRQERCMFWITSIVFAAITVVYVKIRRQRKTSGAAAK
jgi:hypothetical protein